jgi:hypothetical protein
LNQESAYVICHAQGERFRLIFDRSLVDSFFLACKACETARSADVWEESFAEALARADRLLWRKLRVFSILSREPTQKELKDPSETG